MKITDEQLKLQIIEAEKHYQKACEKFSQQQYSEAITLYTESINACKYASNPSTYINRGNAWLILNEYQNAINDFTHPVINLNELNPTDLIVMNTNLGFAYYNTRQFEEAKKCYQRVLKIDPNDDDAKYILSKIANM